MDGVPFCLECGAFSPDRGAFSSDRGAFSSDRGAFSLDFGPSRRTRGLRGWTKKRRRRPTRRSDRRGKLRGMREGDRADEADAEGEVFHVEPNEQALAIVELIAVHIHRCGRLETGGRTTGWRRRWTAASAGG